MKFIYSVNTNFDTKINDQNPAKHTKLYGKWMKTFVRKEGDINDLFSDIQQGFSFGYHYHDIYYDDWKQSKNTSLWISSNFAVVDIDKNLSINEIFGHQLVKQCASLIYPTPNFDHSNNQIRYRLVFLLENTNTDPDRQKDLNRELARNFKQETGQATGLQTSFWGNKKLLDEDYRGAWSQIHSEKFLPDSAVDTLVNHWRSRQPRKTTPPKATGSVTTANSTTTKPSFKPLAIAPTHGEKIDTDTRSTYEVLFPDDVVAGFKVGTLPANQSSGSVSCPFPHYHKNNDVNPSAELINNGIRTFLKCHSEGISRYLVPPTYDDLSEDSLYKSDRINIRYEKYLDNNSKYPVKLYLGVNLVKSYLGSGKTHFLHKVITYAKLNNKTVLIFSHLRSLAFSISSRFGMTCYLKNDYSGNNIATNYYVVSPYSFEKPGLGVVSKQWDYVIIDEIEGLLSGVLAGFVDIPGKIKRVDITLQSLADLINNAESSILMDADLGKQTFNFIKDALPSSKVNLVWNEYKPEQRDVSLCCSLNHLKYLILESFSNNEKFLLLANSKKEIDLIYQYFRTIYPDFKILLITSSTIDNDECRKFIKSPDKLCTNYDAIFYTPSMSTGVSIKPTTKHFDKVYGYFKNSIHLDPVEGTKTTTPLQNSQMLFRYRHIVPIYLFIENDNIRNASWKSPYNKGSLVPIPRNETNILHQRTMDKHIEHYNYLISNYYSMHRAYFKQLGFKCELIYPTNKQEEFGFIFLGNHINATLHYLHYKGYTQLSKTKKFDKATTEDLKKVHHLFKNLDFDLTNLKFKSNDEFQATKSTLRDFTRYAVKYQSDIESILGMKYPVTFAVDPFPVVEKIFSILGFEVGKLQRPHHYQKTKMVDIYRLKDNNI
jgi:hypothetical protein